MILKYGDMADRDGLEAYIDASLGGKLLYERFGCVLRNRSSCRDLTIATILALGGHRSRIGNKR
jgi:hypothetical protein